MRAFEGERRDGADGHAEGGAPETTGGDDGGEAARVPSMERHCSTLEEYGELERAAAFTETCAPDRYLFSVGHPQPPEPIAFPLLTTRAPYLSP